MVTVESRALPRSLRALGQRDFSWFFAGGLVSSIGTNMQVAALAWVVQRHTGSAFRTTAIAFIGIVPLLLLGPAAGVIADRLPRRPLLMVTNALNGAQALGLWLVWIAGYGDRYWLLFVLSLVGGLFTAIQTPAWQALPAELVPREQLANAVTLNSTQFNIARALGPLFAGVTIEAVGAGTAFLVNAISYLFVIAALAMIRTVSARAHTDDDGLGTMRRWLAGVRYVRERPVLVTVIVVHSLFALTVPPVVYLVPKLSIDVLHIGAGFYGLLLGTFGIGAVAAALWYGGNDHRVRSSRALAGGLLLGAVAFLGLGHVRGLALGIVAMTVYGACYLTVVSVNHGTIQTVVDDAHRGRVVSVWLMTFGFFMPVGLLVQGALADGIGVGAVLTIDALLLVGCVVALWASGAARHLDAHSGEDFRPNRAS